MIHFFMDLNNNIYQFCKPLVIENQLFIQAKQILNAKPTFTTPINSIIIDIFSSSGEFSDILTLIPVENIKYKLFNLYSADINHVFLPLEHTSASEFSN